MAGTTRSQWYCRVSIRKDEALPVLCPHCQATYPFGPIFDHAPRVCPNCGITIIEWFLHPNLYVIDIERAPAIVQSLVHSLKPLGEPDAFLQLNVLLEFLGITEKEEE